MPTDSLTIIALLITLSLVLIVLAAAMAWRQRVLRRKLSELHSQVRDVAADSSVGRRLDSPADDDLGPINMTINQLFDALGEKDAAIEERDRWFKRFAQTLPEVTFIHDERFLFANEAAAGLLGVAPEMLVGKPVTDLIKPAYRALFREVTARRLSGETVPSRAEIQLIGGDNGALWVEASSVVVDYQGQRAVLTIARDISHRKNPDVMLGDPGSPGLVALESISESLLTTDQKGLIQYLNAAAETLLQVRRQDVIGLPASGVLTLVDEVDRRSLGDPVAKCLQLRQRVNMGRRAILLRAAGADECAVEMTASPMLDRMGDVAGVVVLFQDVSEIRGHSRQMSYQASHDALTGLINRREFEYRLERLLPDVRAENERHVLAYLDLDRFKQVNDSCGHQAGDALLREVASLLRQQVRDSDSVARIGGDEFTMLLIGCPLDKARQIADDTCRAIAEYRFVWRDRIFTIGVSIGLLELAGSSGSMQDMMAAADSACYMAKRLGRGQVHVYSSEDEIVARERGEIRWLQRLQSALKEGRFSLAMQPIIALAADNVDGPAMEVLLRLRRQYGEVVQPPEFMAAAEKYHLTPDIDRWVVRTTLAALANGEIVLPADRSCCINIAGSTLADQSFLEFVVDALDTSSVSPSSVCFEVTEKAVNDNYQQAQRFIEVLHGMGCRFALDNFGSAPGAFARLKKLPIDFLKIDGTLTHNLASDEVNQEMVAAMIKLAGTLRFRTVAEQVEEQQDFDTLRALGVDYAQGYFINRPSMVGESGRP